MYIKLIYCTAKLPISPTLYCSLSNKIREGLNVKGLSYQYSTRKPVQECKCKIQVLYKWKYLHCDKFCGFMIFRLKPKFHPCKNCYHQKHLDDKIAKCSPSENNHIQYRNIFKTAWFSIHTEIAQNVYMCVPFITPDSVTSCFHKHINKKQSYCYIFTSALYFHY